MRIGLVPGGFKPYHAGHDALIRAASAENDRVIVFYSTSDRSRKGELPISGKNAARVMSQIVSATLPPNVTLREVKAPVGAVFETLISAEDLYLQRCADDTYTIYTGRDDEKNFANIAKYAPLIIKEGHVRIFSLERGSDTPEISGTLMRKSLSEGNVHLFSEGLPATLKPKARQIINTLGFKGDSVTRVPRRRATGSNTSTNMIKTYENYSRSSLRNVVMADFLAEVPRQNHQLLLEDTGSYDSWSASSNVFIKTFIDPFKNAAKAIGVGSLDILNIGAIPLRALVAKIKGSDNALEDAMRGYRSSKEKIEKMWEPIKKFNDNALSGDAQLLAFCLSPKPYIALAFARGIPRASGGLMNALEASGLLPDSIGEKWKNFKEKRSSREESEDEQESERQREKYKNARNRLQRDLGRVSFAIGALSNLNDRDGVKAKIEGLLQKVKENDTKNISANDLGNTYDDKSILSALLAALKESNLSPDKKNELRRVITRIEDNLRIYADGSDGRSSRSLQKIEIDREKIVSEKFRASYRALQVGFKTYAKNVMFFSALQKSNSIEELNRELRSLDISSDSDLKAFVDELNSEVTKSGADKKEVFKVAIQKIKAEIAKTIVSMQQSTLRTLETITKETISGPGPARDIIVKTEEGASFVELIDSVKNAMSKFVNQVHSGQDVSGAAKEISAALRIMQKKSGS